MAPNQGAGHPRPDGKAEEEPIVELSATTTTPPAGMRGHASPAVLLPGPLNAAFPRRPVPPHTARTAARPRRRDAGSGPHRRHTRPRRPGVPRHTGTGSQASTRSAAHGRPPPPRARPQPPPGRPDRACPGRHWWHRPPAVPTRPTRPRRHPRQRRTAAPGRFGHRPWLYFLTRRQLWPAPVPFRSAEAGAAVEKFPRGVEVPGVPGGFLDHVQDDPSQVDGLARRRPAPDIPARITAARGRIERGGRDDGVRAGDLIVVEAEDIGGRHLRPDQPAGVVGYRE